MDRGRRRVRHQAPASPRPSGRPFDATDSLTVLPLTTTDVNAPLLRIPVPPNDTSGLAQISFIMVDKATTVRRSNVRQLVGHLSSQQMTQVERALMVFLGLAD